jgi:hypothetical protein
MIDMQEAGKAKTSILQEINRPPAIYVAAWRDEWHAVLQNKQPGLAEKRRGEKNLASREWKSGEVDLLSRLGKRQADKGWRQGFGVHLAASATQVVILPFGRFWRLDNGGSVSKTDMRYNGGPFCGGLNRGDSQFRNPHRHAQRIAAAAVQRYEHQRTESGGQTAGAEEIKKKKTKAGSKEVEKCTC